MSRSAMIILSAFVTLLYAKAPYMYVHSVRTPPIRPKLDVCIVSFGRAMPQGITSLSMTEPTYAVASEQLALRYNQSFVFDYVRTTAHPCLSTCVTEKDVLARWFYQLQRPGRVLVFVTPGIAGECEASDMSIYQLAASWNTIVMNTNGGVDSTGQTDMSTTVSLSAVSSYPYVTLAAMVVRKYDWSSVFIVWDPASVPVYRSIAIALAASLAKTNRRSDTLYPLLSTSDTGLSEVLQTFHNSSRIMFFYGHAAKLRRLLVTAYTLNMTDGQYVYIAVEVMPALSLYGRLSWRYGDDDDKAARFAFRSLLVLRALSSGVKSTNRTDILAEEFRRRSLSNYNYTYPAGNDLITALMGSYTGVMLLGQVLQEAWKGAENMTDGQRLSRSFRNRTFHTPIEDVFVDNNGARMENRIVAHFTTTSDVLEPILVQYGNTSDYLTTVKEVTDWPGTGEWPPPSEPRCGYKGDSIICQLSSSTETSIGVILGCCFLIGTIVILLVSWLKRDHSEKFWWILNPDRLLLSLWTANTTAGVGCYRASQSTVPGRPMVSGSLRLRYY